MDGQPALSTRNLWFRFPSVPGAHLGAALRGQPRPRPRWVLEDISLEVAQGESLAIVGFNGAGKSTLLRLMAGILSPTRGGAASRLRIASLIDLGATIDGSLSGLENIQLAAAFAGVDRRIATAEIDQAAEFCDLGSALHRPVSEYSRGMRARLSFAAATAFQPEILLIDEVLAVGDITFQRKCIDHLLRFRSEGGTLIFVSHNAANITSVCQRGLHLHEGRNLHLGSAADAIESMYRLQEQQELERHEMSLDPAPSATSAIALDEVAKVSIRSGSVRAHSGESPVWGERAIVEIEVEALEPQAVRLYFAIFLPDDGTCIIGYLHDDLLTLPAGGTRICAEIDEWPILPGHYRLHASVFEPRQFAAPLDEMGWVRPAYSFVVLPSDRPEGRLMAAVGQASTFGHATTVSVRLLAAN